MADLDLTAGRPAEPYRGLVFPAGLSMLWETTDPAGALRDRFGFTDLDHAVRWLTRVLAERWSVEVRSCERILISAGNAIAWAQTDRGPVVVKWSAVEHLFARLAATADLVELVHHQGVPVARPLPSVDGERRIVDTSTARSLSVTVAPTIVGDLLDVHDLPAVHAAGAGLAQLHRALATVTDPRLVATVHEPVDLHARVETWLIDHDSGRAPQASDRLGELVAHLPILDRSAQLVHHDYRSANILTAGSRVTAVLDFDDVTVDHRVVDLAQASVLLATRFRNWGPTTPATRQALVAGYRSIGPLTAAEEVWLQVVILWYGIAQVPPGDDPAGWAYAVAS